MSGPPLLAIIGQSNGTTDTIERSTASLPNAARLTEYGVIIFEPTFHAMFPDMKLPLPRWGGGSLKPDSLTILGVTLASRRPQLEAFFKQGGVLCVLVGPPSALYSSDQYTPASLSPYYLLSPSPESIANMGLAGGSGRSSALLFPEDPMAPFLNERPIWRGTLGQGVFPKANDRFPLAVNNQDEPIAYVEYVGRGVVYYLPQPSDYGEWRALHEGANAAWDAREDLLEEFGLDDEAALQSDLKLAREEFVKVRDRVTRDLRALRAERRELVDRDAVLGRALRYYRAAVHLPPTKALASYYNMWEVIRSESGGADQAQKALGISKKMVDRITEPANRPKLAARHADKDQPVPVEEQEMKDAAESATDIMRRYLKQKLDTWRATPPS